MENVRAPSPLAAVAARASVPDTVCPGCGQGVDPLRAGHVAVLEDRGFHYFCQSLCKQEYLRLRGRPQEEDVATAAPPEVAFVGGPSAPIRAPVGSRIASEAALRDAVDPHAPPATGARPPTPATSAVSSALSRVETGDFARAGIVLPPVLPADPSSAERRPERLLAATDGLGVVAGLLATSVGLLGPAAEIARLPLVLAAWVALAFRVDRAGRDPSDPHPLVVVAPATGAVAAACWARAASDPHAVSTAVLAGLGCAVAIAIEATVARARLRMQSERDRVERALDTRVRAIHGEEATSLPAADVRPGEQIVVEAGELVGVDGVVTAGEGRVIPWLGAEVEVLKREGDPLVAGARVTSSRLRMTTTWSGRERAWVRLLSVPSARIDVAAPTARALRRTVERGSLAAAVLVGVATFAANSTPIAILAAMSAGAMAFAAKGLVSIVGLHFARAHLEALASGITYKDPRAFERVGSANVAVLSAHGTVLLGEPEIVAIEPIAGAVRREGDAPDGDVVRVLCLAAGAETASTHPFAAAILRAARTRAARPDPVRNATVHSGLGVTALASSGERLVVGGRAIMLAEKIGVAIVDARVTELEGQGRSVLLVALGDRVVGLIALQDGLRAGARAAVQRLLDARIEPVLLSGEARDTCETIGRALDIEHVRPAVLPADRGAEVRALTEGGSVVAVVGHPLSDDGALGAADVAIAMGAAGSTPGEWAVGLASDDIRDASLALAIPHATRVRVRAAIVLGATPGIVALLAIGFGVAPLAVAPLGALLGAVAVAVHARESAARATPA